MKRKIVLCIIITLMSFHAACADGTKLSEVTISSQIPLSTNEQNEVAYSVNPISPWEYQSKLGKGMNVDWSKTQKRIIISKWCRTLKLRGLIMFVSG